jgi:hypothetical protein
MIFKMMIIVISKFSGEDEENVVDVDDDGHQPDYDDDNKKHYDDP